MSPAISLRQVVKNYRRGKESVAVLHGLNLEIPQGEFASLMGPSGSGKTTILNLVGGLDHADSGEVIVGGAHLEQMSGGQLTKWRSGHIGFIFQFYNLMPMLSAAGNVELPLLLTNLSKAERRRRVEVALQIVGLADRASHKPGEMSGGQQRAGSPAPLSPIRRSCSATSPPAISTAPPPMRFFPCCSNSTASTKRPL